MYVGSYVRLRMPGCALVRAAWCARVVDEYDEDAAGCDEDDTVRTGDDDDEVEVCVDDDDDEDRGADEEYADEEYADGRGSG